MNAADLAATDMAQAFRSRALSPVDVTRAVLDRIATRAALNAFCHVDDAGALASARASEARHHRGEALGPLDGVPVGIKDLIITRGMPTRRGSLTTDPNAPMEQDAPVVARLREAGCVLLGKTTTPEYGWKGVTDSPLTGITRNPWNTGRTPGGSSGGAAVQVAAGMGPISIGTDGGGSIRIPASFSGVFGFKPSFGRVPAWPAAAVGTLAHTGPLTRNVADAVATMAVISGWDSRDWTALPTQQLDWASTAHGTLRGRRIAFSPDLGFAQVDPEVAALVRRAVGLMEQEGAIVEEVDPGIGAQIPVISVLWRESCARVLRRMTDAQKALLEPAYREAGEAGEAVTLAQYHEANEGRAALAAQMRAFHQTYDLLVTPTMKLTAFPVGQNAPRNADGSPDFGWNALCYQFNLTQQPAASMPCGLTAEGMPVGLQIIGAMHDDLGVLTACHALERVLGPFPTPSLL